MLEVKNLVKDYANFRALKGLTFNVKKNEIFGILGPNGAGKSTLIKILTCFQDKTSGEVKIDNIPIEKKNRIKQLIGWVPQEDTFYHYLTVNENLEYFASLYGLSSKEFKEKSRDLLSLLQIENKKNAIAGSLSGGMKRRLSFAIALMHSPKLLYLDEPTAGVDPVSRRALWDVIKDIKNKGITILFCTHYLDEADLLCDRIAIIKSGQIVTIDTSASIKKNYGKTLEEAFVKIVHEAGKTS
ncbi:MAG TPA: ABC transporter ATP-binding protein [Candidatus Nanoarchaeia archaeon]|nr:ABC transporter ATP-binding protein [Candidatus Nanoarchaeia archaeon]